MSSTMKKTGAIVPWPSVWSRTKSAPGWFFLPRVRIDHSVANSDLSLSVAHDCGRCVARRCQCVALCVLISERLPARKRPKNPRIALRNKKFTRTTKALFFRLGNRSRTTNFDRNKGRIWYFWSFSTSVWQNSIRNKRKERIGPRRTKPNTISEKSSALNWLTWHPSSQILIFHKPSFCEEFDDLLVALRVAILEIEVTSDLWTKTREITKRFYRRSKTSSVQKMFNGEEFSPTLEQNCENTTSKQ